MCSSDLPNNEIWAIEIKSGLTAKPAKGFYNAIKDIKSTHNFIVYAGKESYPIAESIEAVGLISLMKLIDKQFSK